MYESKFKPFHELHDFTNLAEGDKKENLETQEDSDCNNFAHEEQVDVEALKAKIKILEEELEVHKTHAQELLKERESLLEEIQKLKKRQEAQEMFLSALDELLRSIEGLKGGLKEDVISISLDIVKRLLSMNSLPKEEGLLKALSDALDKGLVVGGSCVIRINPEDKESLGETIEELFQKAGLFSLSVVADNSLKRGEFIVETPKLYVERRYDDLLEEFLKDLADGSL